MATEKVTYIIEGRDKLSPILTKLSNKSQRLERNLRNVTSKKRGFGKATSGATGLSGALLGLGAAVGGLAILGQGAKAILNLGLEMEKTRVSFQTFLRDKTGEKTTRLLNQLNQFANVTPFDNTQVIKASKTLLAFGIPANELIGTLRFLGDVSAGTGKDLGEMGVIFGQIRGAGRLMGQDLLQLISAGFNPLAIIAEKTGRKMGDLKDDMAKGLISFDDVKNAFITATSEGGQFFNLMEKQSKTVSGRISTLAGTVQLLGITIGESILPAVGRMVDAFQAFTKFVRDNLEGLKRVFKPLIDAILAPLKTLIMVVKGIAGAFGFTSTEGITLTKVFTVLGNVIEIITIPVRLFFKAFQIVNQVMIRLISTVVNFIKSFEIVKQFFLVLPRIAQGAFKAIKTQFDLFGETALKILGNVGQLLLGIFTFDTAKIKAGFNGLRKTVAESGAQIAKDFQGGFRDGFSLDFFGDQMGAAADVDGGPGGLPPPAPPRPPGGPGPSGGIGADVRGAQGTRLTNLTINITKLVETLEIKTTNLRESSTKIREEVARALLTAVNDVNIISG